MLGLASGHGTFAAVVWVHHGHAVIARRDAGRCRIEELDRAGDPEVSFLRRVAAAAPDCRRMMILGPDDEHVAFDHAYDELYDRRGRFVEVEACVTTSASELLDRLRFLEAGETGEGGEAGEGAGKGTKVAGRGDPWP